MFTSKPMNHSRALPGPKDAQKNNVEISEKKFNAVESRKYFRPEGLEGLHLNLQRQ